MFLKGLNIQLIPYSAEYWQYLAKWFYAEEYSGMWRHHPRAMTQAQFERYPQVIGGEVFLVLKAGTAEPVGFVQLIPDCKTNRGFFVGMVLDKDSQKANLCGEILHLFFDYAFNRMGYRKAILEVLESNESLNKVLTTIGFLKEGKFIAEAFVDGNFVDEVRYCMLVSYFNKHFKATVDSWKDN